LALAVIGIGTSFFPLILVCASVVLGYLLFNFPLGFNRPVRAFMGDAGSTSLGLVIATVGILLSQGPTPRIAPVTGLWIVAVPVFDLFSAIVRRSLAGKSPFAPDHSHLHHVLIENGLSRRDTLFVLLFIATVFASVGWAGDMIAAPDGVMLLLWLAAGVAYYQLMRYPGPVVRIARRFLPVPAGVASPAENVAPGVRPAD
jgi:UDP-GlcNAc:undecaprenyl-phosphate GlcNAc-1-phosphate transferase